MSERRWIVAQLGAREHYVLARGLHAEQRLAALMTDIWATPGALSARLPGGVGRRVSERHVAGLTGARIEHFTASALAFEAGKRVGGAAPGAWPTIMARNVWFQQSVVRRLARTALLTESPVVFAYSYAALDILRAAKAAGGVAVLGQIDPAITEEGIVADAVARHADLNPSWSRAPADYWALWREECAIADRIIVNSPWAHEGLVTAGIEADKIRIVPLAYEGAASAEARAYPATFSAARPLRILFLGSLIVRKGIAELIAATRLLDQAPVEFHLVGGAGIDFPEDVIANPKVHRHGPVERGGVDAHYAAADVFILPSLSDGFGLTMLEAMAHGLPVIASRRCGDVIEDGLEGVLLDAVSGEAIATAIRRLLDDPAQLDEMSRSARTRVADFRAATVRDRLVEAVDAL